MTAAYTDDPTIVQEQKTDKRIAAATARTPSGNKERGTREEEASIVEDNSEETRIMPKLATGGQDKEVQLLHPVDLERTTVSCVSDDSTGTHDRKQTKDESLEKKEPLESPESSFEVLEKGQSSVGSKNCEITRDNVEPKTEKKVENVDRDSDASGQEIAIDDAHFVEEEARDVVPKGTRVDPSSSPRMTNSTKSAGSVDASRMQLQELRSSLESIEHERKDQSAESFEALESFVVVESAFSRDTSDETYDPESELNFHEAVRAGDAKCVAALLACGSVQNLDEPDWNVSGDPPLLVAATNHCLPVLSLLLANGCDPAVRSPRGETALHRVILNGGPGNVLKFVGELLKYGCPPGVKEAGGGLTALHVLTRQLAHAQGSKNLHHNFEAALKTLELLAHAGPVNAKDHQGRSALHILASSTIFDNNHRTEIESLIETLLAAGADPALKNDRGETPLHECLECGALNTAFLLIPHTPTGITSRYGETPLHIASRKNYVDMVAKLLEHGEDPSVQDAGGNTPLHLASARGFHQTVSLLVTSPLAQLEKLNIEGLTALQVAAESGFVNAVKLLLKAGADPSQTVHYCTTTLHRHPDISVLIDHELSRRRQLAA